MGGKTLATLRANGYNDDNGRLWIGNQINQ